MVFRPSGKVARWKLIYELLELADVGETVSYQDLAEAIELDPDADRRPIQAAIPRAAKELEEIRKRAVEVVPNMGYRIVEASDQLRLARAHQRRADNQLVRGRSKAVNVDLSGLDVETRNAFEVVARGFALQMDFNRRLSERQDRADRLIDELAVRIESIEKSQT